MVSGLAFRLRRKILNPTLKCPFLPTLENWTAGRLAAWDQPVQHLGLGLFRARKRLAGDWQRSRQAARKRPVSADQGTAACPFADATANPAIHAGRQGRLPSKGVLAFP
jgi:hypothetical protein